MLESYRTATRTQTIVVAYSYLFKCVISGTLSRVRWSGKFSSEFVQFILWSFKISFFQTDIVFQKIDMSLLFLYSWVCQIVGSSYATKKINIVACQLDLVSTNFVLISVE